MKNKTLPLFLTFVAFVVLNGLALAQTSLTITGPAHAGVGELCVFTLSGNTNIDESIADWTIVPPIDFYVDSSKRTLVFSTPKANHYTMIAATIVESKPLVLTFVCDYGITPSPEPTPTPTPEPEPKTLKDWVKQNIPQQGTSEVKFLAENYESVASALERGTIRTAAAGYAAIRTASQTKINPKIWSEFLNGLEKQIHENVGDSPTPK
ncbi:MAG: hypothetical protein LBJ67_05730, partial [Planctomycetaceae bacterium]|nr:hypothetical protein [Planctomycetaceae bacterium]